ncbi:hypothetical protein [Clostridium tunisiense]|uniref:hypothetical protein n=1 Tax=Clostridium tunisiense TaxID=219748 RepID=UPI0002DD443E|nr:hypothetical protein [Clostridium tunisiense]
MSFDEAVGSRVYEVCKYYVMEMRRGGRGILGLGEREQSEFQKAIGIEKDIVTQEFVVGINSVRAATLEDFETEALNSRLEKDGGLGFDFNMKTISFDFLDGLEDEEIKKQFANALNEGAIKLKHTSFKEKETDNEKFAIQTWILRLGFIGDR